MRISNISFSAVAIAAAAMTFGSGRSFADSLTAKVPFAFQVQEQQLPSGQYEITKLSNNGAPLLLLRNLDSHKSIFILTRNPARDSNEASPRMVFQCREGEAGCYLSEIWGATGHGVGVYPPRHPDEFERPTLVYMKGYKSGQ